MDILVDQADQGRKKRGSTFLKMFRFDKARTPKQASDGNTQSFNMGAVGDQSVDYANYLLEI